ncbi:MAG: hypothetical protein AAGN35_15930 [Bacteroidota bacterium]
MRRQLIFLLLLGWGSLFAQDPLFQGTWLGKLTQEGQPAPYSSYRFRMHIAQNGNLLSGTTYISLPDSLDIYAEMEFMGFTTDDVMTFRETRERRGNDAALRSWCIKDGTLRVTEKGGLYRLEGDWQGSTARARCAPGKIILERLNPNPPSDAPLPDSEAEQALRVYGALDGRPINRQREVPVGLKRLRLYVWDADKVDGDVISLSYNGKWLLQNYPLRKQKRMIEIELDDNADNRLILYAENEGRFPPNTAALTFFDGKKERNLSLVSTENFCGALKFVLVP